jgi:HEAT repeat protein
MKVTEREIREQLRSPNEEQRHRAVQSLPEVFSEIPKDLLLQALGDSSWRVRKCVADVVIRSPLASVIAVLIKALGDDDNAGLRNSATEVLVELGAPAVSQLIELLKKGNHDERKFSADILGAIGDSQSVPALLEGLSDADDNVRAASAEALGHIGDPRVGNRLLDLLQKDQLLVQLSCMDALERLVVEVPFEILNKLLHINSIRPQVFRLLGALSDKRVVSILLPALMSRGRTERAAAARAIVRHHAQVDNQRQAEIRAEVRSMASDDLCRHLRELIKSSDADEREAGVVLLGWTGRHDTVNDLLQAVGDERLHDRIYEALLAIGEPVIEVLNQSLPNLGRLELVLVLEVLGHFRARESLESIVVLCGADEEEVAEAARRALTNIHDSSVIPTLCELLQNETGVRLNGIASSLISLGDDYHDQVVAGIQAVLASGSAEQRRAAAEVLGGVARPIDMALLMPMFGDEDSQLRAAAVAALGRIECPGDMERLRMALTDEYPIVRAAAAEALGQRNSSEAVAALQVALTDPDSEVVRITLMSLRQDAAQQARAAILPLIIHPNGALALEAVRTLNVIGWGDDETWLCRAGQHADPEVVKEVLAGAVRPSATRFEVIENALNHSRWDVRMAAVKQVGTWKDPQALDALKKRLPVEDDELVMVAIQQLLKSNDGKSSTS